MHTQSMHSEYSECTLSIPMHTLSMHSEYASNAHSEYKMHLIQYIGGTEECPLDYGSPWHRRQPVYAFYPCPVSV